MNLDEDTYHKIFRQYAVNEIKMHAELYSSFQDNLNEYAIKMQEDHYWGDHIVIQALSNALQRTIIIYLITNHNPPLSNSPSRGTAQGPPIELVFLAGCHFECVINITLEPSTQNILPQFNISALLTTSLSSDEKCIEWLRENQILPQTIKCSKCKKEASQTTNNPLLYRCQNCDGLLNIRNHSVLSYINAPIRKFIHFALTWLQGKERVHQEQDTGIPLRTCIRYSNTLNLCATIIIQKSSFQLGGPNRVVEVDEANIPRCKNHVGREKEDCWVMGFVLRPQTDTEVPPAVFFSLAQRTKEELEDKIKKWIAPGSTICSDCWSSYSGIGELGFQHYTVNHSHNFVDPISGAHT